jgi:multidrug efflux pump subunit AcrB
VLLSYLEAITLAPARCAQILDVSREGRSAVGRGVDGIFSSLARGYARVLRGHETTPKVLASSVASALPARRPRRRRACRPSSCPSQDQSRLMVRIQTGPSASDLGETDRLLRAPRSS